MKKFKLFYVFILFSEAYFILISPLISCAVFDKRLRNNEIFNLDGVVFEVNQKAPHLGVKSRNGFDYFTLPVSGLTYSQKYVFKGSDDLNKWLKKDVNISYIKTIKNLSTQNVVINLSIDGILIFNKEQAVDFIQKSRNWNAFFVMMICQLILFVFIYFKLLRG